jgi:hypothetical protein
VLFAERAIQAGEEIVISYSDFRDVSKKLSSQQSRQLLNSTWGIECKSNCFCYDPDIERIVEQSKELDSVIPKLARTGKADRALRAVKELIENHTLLHSSWISRERTLYDGFQISIARRETFKLAEEYIRKAYEIRSSITHPQSRKALQYGRWATTLDFHDHHNYLRMDS